MDCKCLNTWSEWGNIVPKSYRNAVQEDSSIKQQGSNCSVPRILHDATILESILIYRLNYPIQ